jgi:HD-GYP domain-containing protein (c-di-GMP phosphodiesterase class II)
MLTEKVKIEIQLRFLYPGMLLKGDAFDDGNELILREGEAVTPEFLNSLKQKRLSAIYYIREKLKLRKDLTKSMVSEKNIESAMGIVEQIAHNVKSQSHGIPQKEVNEVVSNFVTDINSNQDAYLNLLELIRTDDYNYTHAVNVSTIAILLGTSLKLDEGFLNAIGTAGLLHDVGKSFIPDEIWDKPGKLTEDEWKIVRNHPVYSYNIVKAENAFDPRVEKGILLHHENYRGGGYPLGVSHEKLDTVSQVLAISDSFDALTSRRPYKAAWAFDEAFTHLMENSGSRFNPTYVQVFLRDMVKKINETALYSLGDYVLLNTGEIAFVQDYRSSQFTLRPIVNIFFNPTRGNDVAQQLLKYIQQIDLEQDYKRFIVKKILDPKYIAKFDTLLGQKAPEHTKAVKENACV